MTRGLVRKDRMREIPPLKTHTRRTCYHLLHRDSFRLLGEFDEMGLILGILEGVKPSHSLQARHPGLCGEAMLSGSPPAYTPRQTLDCLSQVWTPVAHRTCPTLQSTAGTFIAGDVAQGRGWSSLESQCFYSCCLWAQAPSKLISPTVGCG